MTLRIFITKAWVDCKYEAEKEHKCHWDLRKSEHCTHNPASREHGLRSGGEIQEKHNLCQVQNELNEFRRSDS